MSININHTNKTHPQKCPYYIVTISNIIVDFTLEVIYMSDFLK